ncbi:MAG: hypothetical protein JNN16_04295 [Nitrospira sp.]|jgi:hypothetical protein|nr:hypothetical protein [Nitrospira sp.]
MIETFKDIHAPPDTAGPATIDQVVNGMRIPAHQQIILYTSSQWEDLIHEWAHYCLKKQYVQVQRFGGAGDHGIDIAGFESDKKLQGAWDNYQCKHYDHALYPSDALPEIGKVLWHSFKKEYKAPRKYYFVAPKGTGTTLTGYLSNAEKLKKAVITQWSKDIGSKITSKEQIPLKGDFLQYVQNFDFSSFDARTTLEIIEDHKKCPCHAVRFGGGLRDRPESEKPPEIPAATESRYVGQLYAAYSDHVKSPVLDMKALKQWPKLDNHFSRQREAFYHAESLRVFARDTVPTGTFESLQEDIYSGVIDVHNDDHEDGYKRVLSVTKAARELNLTSNALLSRSKPADRDGICHQLANEDRFEWKKQ